MRVPGLLFVRHCCDKPILIFGYFGAPQMGITGAAVATVLSQSVAAVIAFLLNVRKNPDVTLRFRIVPSFRAVKRILYLGLPTTVIMSLGSFMMINYNSVLNRFSTAWLLAILTDNLDMVWLSVPVADTVSAGVGVILIRHYYKKDVSTLVPKKVKEDFK